MTISVGRSRQSFGLARIIAAWLTITTTSAIAGVPINQHYAEPVVVVPAGSEDYLSTGLYSMGHLAVGDITGDGRDDVIFTGAHPVDEYNSNIDDAKLIVISRNEAGQPESVAADIVNGAVPRMDGFGARKLIIRDFNGDDRPDLYLSGTGPELICQDGSHNHCHPGLQNRLLLSNVEGKLDDVTATHLPQFNDFTHGASAADFDGDGDIDLWANNFGKPPENPLVYPRFAYLMFNDGAGRFTVVADLGVNHPDPLVGPNGRLPDDERLGGFWSTAIDVDGDGDSDLFLGLGGIAEACPNWYCPPTGEIINQLLLNDGRGRFHRRLQDPVPWTQFGPSWVQGSQAYDVNQDGLQDLLLHQTSVVPYVDQLWEVDWETVILQILISNGDGSFRDETATRFPNDPVTNFPYHFQLHDMDGDGHMDLFRNVLDNGMRINDIRINDGEGNFRALGSNWSQLGSSWAVFDMDGDGGSDFLDDIQEGFVVHKMVVPYGPEINGTNQPDTLAGGARDETILGFGHNDILDGGLGDDLLDGGPGNNTLIGGKGNDTFVYHFDDAWGYDTIRDKQGKDTLKLADFGLEAIISASQTSEGHLLLVFQPGLNLTVEQHFVPNSHGIERLEVGDCVYVISKDPGFESGAIQDLLGGCILFEDGFE